MQNKYDENRDLWSLLVKKLIWRQLGDVRGKRVLEFGSGEGITADHYAAHNDVVAIEPDINMVQSYTPAHAFQQLIGSEDQLSTLPDQSFDMITCHNVLEFVDDRALYLHAFERLLKLGGTLSIVKHNLAGRVMHMVVLNDEFQHANDLLDGAQGISRQFGAVRYYTQNDLERDANGLLVDKTYGIRTFWQLQQNQAMHPDPSWQQQMLDLEMRVGTLPEYQSVSFFHHHILHKK